jgi:mannose-6-phosphate isomerase-like protein (cupin superfamily)
MQEKRPWGWYLVIDTGDRYKVKSIEVNPGHSLSLQRHFHRSEHWVVVEGTSYLEEDDIERFDDSYGRS